MSSSKTETISVEQDAAFSPSSLLIAYLSGSDVPCPQCAYNLRNLQGNRCPECGEELVLRVNRADPRQKLVIAGVIGLSAGAGFSALMILIGLIMLGIHGSIGDSIRLFTALGGGLVIESVAIYCWLRNWRRIRNLSTITRVWLVVACWVLSLLNAVVLALYGA
jgi:hypothetical protein